MRLVNPVEGDMARTVKYESSLVGLSFHLHPKMISINPFYFIDISQFWFTEMIRWVPRS